MDIILGKVICLVVDQVNTYISLVLGTGSGRSPFFCLTIACMLSNSISRRIVST